MGDLSKNLSRHEMACECGCGFDTVDVELVEVLQDVCDHFRDETGYKVILIITGPNRCDQHNATIKGAAKNSEHKYARASDFQLKANGAQIPPTEVYNYLDAKYPGKYGIGLYSNRVHLDTRTGPKARWP